MKIFKSFLLASYILFFSSSALAQNCNYEFQIFGDQFAQQETSAQIIDEFENVLLMINPGEIQNNQLNVFPFQGNSQSNFMEILMFDAAGNGLACMGINGYYMLAEQGGNVLLPPQHFGVNNCNNSFQEIQMVPTNCGAQVCDLQAEIVDIIPDDNGTPNNPNDDVWFVEIFAQNGPSTTGASLDGPPFFVQYGAPSIVGPFSDTLSEAHLVLVDMDNPNCVFLLEVSFLCADVVEDKSCKPVPQPAFTLDIDDQNKGLKITTEATCDCNSKSVCVVTSFKLKFTKNGQVVYTYFSNGTHSGSNDIASAIKISKPAGKLNKNSVISFSIVPKKDKDEFKNPKKGLRIRIECAGECDAQKITTTPISSTSLKVSTEPEILGTEVFCPGGIGFLTLAEQPLPGALIEWTNEATGQVVGMSPNLFVEQPGIYFVEVDGIASCPIEVQIVPPPSMPMVSNPSACVFEEIPPMAFVSDPLNSFNLYTLDTAFIANFPDQIDLNLVADQLPIGQPGVYEFLVAEQNEFGCESDLSLVSLTVTDAETCQNCDLEVDVKSVGYSLSANGDFVVETEIELLTNDSTIVLADLYVNEELTASKSITRISIIPCNSACTSACSATVTKPNEQPKTYTGDCKIIGTACNCKIKVKLAFANIHLTPWDEIKVAVSTPQNSPECNNANNSLTTVVHQTYLFAKVNLTGAFEAATNLMMDQLRTQQLIPMIATDGKVIAPGVLDTTGPNAIVDWVTVELRDALDPAKLVYSTSALLERDGDLVDVDGLLGVPILAQGTYFVVISHRNHLPISTAIPVDFREDLPVLDFILDPGLAFGIQPQFELLPGIYGLYPGDANGDQAVDAGDRGAVWNNRNLTGYRTDDLNLDGINDAADRVFCWNFRNHFFQLP